MMNRTLYVENSHAAEKYARHDLYENVHSFLKFYKDSEGFTKYYTREPAEIMKRASGEWQDIMDSINSYALYLGTTSYKRYLDFANSLKELLDRSGDRYYTTIGKWKEECPDLIVAYEKAEASGKGATESEDLFIAYANELYVAVNNQFLRI